MKYPDPVVQYLKDIRIPLRLGALTRSGWPIVLSLWYVFMDGKVYCSTQKSAKIVTKLGRDPRCSFEVAGEEPPYCGVRSRALAVVEPEKGPVILKRLLERYLDDLDTPLARNLLSRMDDEVAIQLTPQSVYTWNFSDRMRDSVSVSTEKPCPPGKQELNQGA